MDTFGWRLTKELRRQRMTQKTLAELIDMPQSNVSRLCGGIIANPRLSTILRLAAILDVPVSRLVDGVSLPSKSIRGRPVR